MPLVLILLAVIMMAVVLLNKQGNLGSALTQDVPGFGKWFAAVALVGGIGYIPGLQVPSRWLLGLVLGVLFLANYRQALTGLTDIASGASASSSTLAGNPSPAALYVANPSAPQITQASITGTTAGASGVPRNAFVSVGSPVNVSTIQQASVSSPFGQYDPNAFLRSFLAGGIGSMAFDAAGIGFGGLA